MLKMTTEWPPMPKRLCREIENSEPWATSSPCTNSLASASCPEIQNQKCMVDVVKGIPGFPVYGWWLEIYVQICIYLVLCSWNGWQLLVVNGSLTGCSSYSPWLLVPIMAMIMDVFFQEGPSQISPWGLGMDRLRTSPVIMGWYSGYRCGNWSGCRCGSCSLSEACSAVVSKFCSAVENNHPPITFAAALETVGQ